MFFDIENSTFVTEIRNARVAERLRANRHYRDAAHGSTGATTPSEGATLSPPLHPRRADEDTSSSGVASAVHASVRTARTLRPRTLSDVRFASAFFFFLSIADATEVDAPRLYAVSSIAPSPSHLRSSRLASVGINVRP